MGRRLMQVAVVVILFFVAAQLTRSNRIDPPTDPSRTIQAHAGSTRELAARPRDGGGRCQR